MNRTKLIKGECQHCGRPLQFPAEQIGLTAPCPHCRQQTELMLARPPDEPTVPRRVLIWTLIAVLILSGGLVASLVALKRAEKLVGQKRMPTPAANTNTAPASGEAK